MMYSVYYGELSEARKEKWNNGKDNPYDIKKRVESKVRG